MTKPPEAVEVLILAGRRPGTDPLLDARPGVATKALIPIAGRAMIARVIAAVAAAPAVGDIIVAAQDHALIAGHPDVAGLGVVAAGRVRFVDSQATISATVAAHAAEAAAKARPLVVTTADHALLTPTILQWFITAARGAGVEVAAGVVERRVLEAAYPANRRTWLRFRGGAWSGANLFWLDGPGTGAVTDLWARIEADRKKGRAIIGAMGPLLLLGASLRLLTIDQAVTRAGRRLGVRARTIVLPMAEVCIDADKPDDLALIEQILARRPD